MAEQPPPEVQLLNLCLRLLSVRTNGTPAHTTRAESRYGRRLMWPLCSIAQASFALLLPARGRHRHSRCQSRRVAQTIPRQSCARRGYRLHPPRPVLPPGEESPGTACFRRTHHLKSAIRARRERKQPVLRSSWPAFRTAARLTSRPNPTLRPQYRHVLSLKRKHQSTLPRTLLKRVLFKVNLCRLSVPAPILTANNKVREKLAMNSRQAKSCVRGPGRSAVLFRYFSFACILLFILLALDCHSAGSGIVLTVIDQGWLGSGPRLAPEVEEFTRQTGIRVQILPAPEAAVEQLATWRELLDSRTKTPDVYAIDVIWPRLLADSLIDLKPYVPSEDIAAHFPELIANYTVDGKLIALPHNLNEGLLFYRTDLLAK